GHGQPARHGHLLGGLRAQVLIVASQGRSDERGHALVRVPVSVSPLRKTGISFRGTRTRACPPRRYSRSSGNANPDTGRALSSSRLKRNSAAARPPVSTSKRPRPSTRSARSRARRKFCL